MADPILLAEDVSVERSGRRILEGVSLSIPRESRLLVRGRSGAGKTTLFHVLGLLEPPTTGRLVVDGTDAATIGERERARLRRETIGIIFQDFLLVPDLTARENVALPQEHAGDRDEEWIDALLDRLEMTDRADAYPATLSGGEKQRVAIARALANRPAVVLADEPTGQLDHETAAGVLSLLLSLHEETGTALVVVSHDRDLTDSFPDSVRMEDGRLVAESSGAAASPESARGSDVPAPLADDE